MNTLKSQSSVPHERARWLLPLFVMLMLGVGAVAWLSAQSHGTGSQFDRIGADPAYIVVNKSTPVVFTAKITDPQLKKRSVILLRVDATGKPTDILGRLKDDGTSGDAKANDNIYSIRTILTEPAVGLSAFRIAARFKPGKWTEPEPDDDDWDRELATVGQSGRDRPVIHALILALLNRIISKRYTLSNPIQVTVDPFKLPPDPGEAGKQTLQGIDSDRDGVRDDIQRYIAITYASSERLRAGATQLAKGGQELLLGGGQQDLTAAVNCLYAVSPSNARLIGGQVRSQLLNTPQRLTAWNQSNDALGGHVFENTSPSEWVSQCAFNPASLPN